jgi:uncharacterized membrane protein YhaH (DUF805 family)
MTIREMITDYLFSFKGRVPRELMWVYLAIAIPALLAVLIAMAILGTGILFAILALPTAGVLFYALLAIGAKRRHDRDANGQICLMLLVVLIASFVLGGFLPATPVGVAVGRVIFGVRFLILLYYFIVLFCLPGTQGENAYGSDPIVPELDPNDPSYVPAGFSVKVSGAGTHQEFFYVAESNPERARAIIREARGASDGSVTIMGTILHQTVTKLGLHTGEFVPAPRIQA